MAFNDNQPILTDYTYFTEDNIQMNVTNEQCLLMNYTYTRNFTCQTYLHYVQETQELENRLFQYWIIIASVYIILM